MKILIKLDLAAGNAMCVFSLLHSKFMLQLWIHEPHSTKSKLDTNILDFLCFILLNSLVIICFETFPKLWKF